MFGRPPFTSIFGSAPRIIHLLGSTDAEDTGKDASQADDITAVERQIDNTAVIHEAGEGCRIRVDERRLRCDGYLRFDRAQLKGRIHAQVLTHTQLQSGLGLFLKAFHLERKLILSRRQGQEIVESLGICPSGSGGLLLDHFSRDGDVWNGGPG